MEVLQKCRTRRVAQVADIVGSAWAMFCNLLGSNHYANSGDWFPPNEKSRTCIYQNQSSAQNREETTQ